MENSAAFISSSVMGVRAIALDAFVMVLGKMSLTAAFNMG